MHLSHEKKKKEKEKEGVGHCFVYYFSIWFIPVLICITAMMMIISTFWKKKNTLHPKNG
jgi:hypothetical protein